MYSDVSAKTQENFSGARLIRAFAQEEAEIASFETANREYIRRSLHLVSLMAMLWPSLEFLLGLAPMITLLVGGHLVIQHRISTGDFTAFGVYMVQLIFPLIAVGWVVNIFQRGTASVVRIDELLKQQPDIADDPTLVTTNPKITGKITFRNLTFAYPTGPNVLEDINLEIPAGTSLAIVGPTGSGKSTLVNLIPRLLDAIPGPDGESTVLIDGQTIRSYTLDTLRASIGFVPQETFLFSETIRQNIAFGVHEATDAEIQHAATVAHIATEILEFPRGFQTMVGERGLTLSGGQKQRTAIARAVIRNPRILILDDALASVDTYTEEQILAGLRRVMQGRTTVFISHRISTARNADQIAVLVAGRIVERGTHDELLLRDGYYTSLYEKQRLEEEIAVTT
jgi:ATP-binding cassette subfamily B protein